MDTEVSRIINMRKRLRLSQTDFSVLLGFGRITIARYESRDFVGTMPVISIIALMELDTPNAVYTLMRLNGEKISLQGKKALMQYLSGQGLIKQYGMGLD